MEHQNWTVNYIQPKCKDVIKASGGTGKSVGVPKTNKKLPGKAPHLVDDDAMKGHDIKMAIMQARNEKGWTQTDLAQRICVKPDVVKSYENGTAIPDNNLIAKMERALDCKLPRHKKNK